jgi:hypothetical protein
MAQPTFTASRSNLLRVNEILTVGNKNPDLLVVRRESNTVFLRRVIRRVEN